MTDSTGRGGSEFSHTDSDGSAVSDAKSLKNEGTSWLGVAWLMLSDVVGTSVLTFAGVAMELGWLPTVIFIVVCFPMAMYVSVCMCRTRTLIEKTAKLRLLEPPPLDSMGAVAAHVIRSPASGTWTFIAVYGYNLLGQASYLLILGTSLQQLFYDSGICIYWAVAIGCVCLLPAVIGVRRLGESVLLCFGNLILIVVVLFLALGSIVHRGRPPCETSPAVEPGLTAFTALGAATNVIYSYCGQWMYFEIMETMESPSDFPKAFMVTGPFMVIAYLTVALVSFFFGVQTGNIVDSMPAGPLLRVVAICLFLHVGIVYLIKSVVLQIFFHAKCSPHDLNSRRLKSYLKHGSFGLAMLIFGFLIANAVPFFSQLLGLIGGLLGGPINFMFPLYLYLAAKGRHDKVESESKQAVADEAPHGSETEPWEESSLRACCRGIRSTRPIELLCIAAIMMVTLMIVFLGVAQEIMEIIKLNGEFGEPFSCHALKVDVATPQCA